MGITIHYRGTLSDLSQLSSLTTELQDIAQSMQWQWSTEKSSDGFASLARDFNISGISLMPHTHCEPLFFFSNQDGELVDPRILALNPGKTHHSWISIKTQFAPPQTHMWICGLLRYLKKNYLPDLEVVDEGGYWDTQKQEVLDSRLQLIARTMDVMEEELSSHESQDNHLYTPEEIVHILEKLFRDKLGPDRKR
ncbi:MAG: hypothetical protein ACOC41_05245 [Chitinivibrionales bacterium]